MDAQLIQPFSQPLPIVVLILGLFAICFFALVGLTIADQIIERRTAKLTQSHSFQLSFESLINELTAYA